MADYRSVESLSKEDLQYMLSKCANPACSNKFRYLYEGKLFLTDFPAGPTRGKSGADLPDSGKLGAVDYVWLCSSCCREMTVCVDGQGKFTVVRNPAGDRAQAERAL